MFNKFRTFGIDLSFCLRKEAVIDLLKTLDEDLSTLYKEKSDAYTAAATVYSFGILYNRGEISRSLPEKLTDTKRKFHYWGAFESYCTPNYPSFCPFSGHLVLSRE